MERAVLVYVDLEGVPRLVGRLWARARKGRESATFEYDAAWLADSERFALEPALSLFPGPQHTAAGRALFGALGDSAPDRWGRSRYGAQPNLDMRGLWRRVVFNVLVSNTDDHLRNHGFLDEGGRGWRLSPAYDLNPVPTDVRECALSVAITLDDPTASLSLAMEVAEYFGLPLPDARRIASEVGISVSQWRQEASRVGIERAEIDRMASAFEHDDLRQSLAMGTRRKTR